MLKFFFWLLLLANAGLFAYQQGYLGNFVSDGREPTRLARQLNADKIRLIAVNATAGSAAAASDAPSAPDAALAADKKPDASVCTEIGNFTDLEAKRFETQLAPLALGERLSKRTVQETASYMIYIPPQGSKENADKKANELRHINVLDFAILQDTPNLRWALSLGVFSTPDAAKSRLAELNKKGVHSARLLSRSAATKVAFQLKDLDAAAKDKLDKINAGYIQQATRSCGAA